jgi:hypothetical protein
MSLENLLQQAYNTALSILKDRSAHLMSHLLENVKASLKPFGSRTGRHNVYKAKVTVNSLESTLDCSLNYKMPHPEITQFDFRDSNTTHNKTNYDIK